MVCACIQAGRGRFNWAWFSPHAVLHRPDAEEHTAGTAEEFVAALGSATTAVWVVGEVDRSLRTMLQSLSHVTVVAGAGELRRAGHLAALAAQHFAAGTCDEVSILQPLYLRAP
jgi:tRNA A37 threonylcarbamoyladenosine modification protein TsaB